MLAVLVLSAASPARALTDEEIFRNFRFNLINPGARSLAMGGAFVSLADDATAAQANPAGLGFLRRWELFSEFRTVDNVAQSTIENETLPSAIEASVAVGTDIDDVSSLTFLSGVLPFQGSPGPFKAWTGAVSRQQVLNIQNETLSQFFLTAPGNPGAFRAEGQGSIDVEIVNYNASLGVRIGDRWGIGTTFTYSTLDVVAEVTNNVIDTSGILANDPILQGALNLQTNISDSDDDFSFSIGGLYRVQGKWQVGLVYRNAADYSVDESLGRDGPGLDIFDVNMMIGSPFPNRFNLPDSIGAGGSVMLAGGDLTLAVDVVRINYSDLADGFVPGINLLTGFDAQFEIDDATDFRGGAEYLLPWKKLTTLLRAGYFFESDATISARSTGTMSFASENIFRGGDDLHHATIGLGLVFDRVKVDVAADFSDHDNEYLISVIFQGKRE